MEPEKNLPVSSIPRKKKSLHMYYFSQIYYKLIINTQLPNTL